MKLQNRRIFKTRATSEIVAYHKVKRIFLNLIDMQKEDPDQLEVYEFMGENFQLVAR